MPSHTKAERKKRNPLKRAAEAVFKSRGMRKQFKPTVRKRRKRQALGA